MITKEIVDHIAWLARIKLSEEEKEKFARQLSKILEYFDMINKVDTSGVEPTFHVLELRNVFRDDNVEKSLPQKVVLESAGESKDGFVKAPKIL